MLCKVNIALISAFRNSLQIKRLLYRGPLGFIDHIVGER
jgi:hypothetical protein